MTDSKQRALIAKLRPLENFVTANSTFFKEVCGKPWDEVAAECVSTIKTKIECDETGAELSRMLKDCNKVWEHLSSKGLV